VGRRAQDNESGLFVAEKLFVIAPLYRKIHLFAAVE
jgi:hypothetical protein